MSRPTKGVHRCTHSVWNINHRETWTPWETLGHPPLLRLSLSLDRQSAPLARNLPGQKNPRNFYEKPVETRFSDQHPPDKKRARINIGRGERGGRGRGEGGKVEVWDSPSIFTKLCASISNPYCGSLLYEKVVKLIKNPTTTSPRPCFPYSLLRYRCSQARLFLYYICSTLSWNTFKSSS